MLIFYFSCLILLFFKLFKLIDVEEITLKAGNFKKFGVFIKMLMSALDKENDSVYVDVLTYSDLEALKARKTGAPTPSTSAADGGAKMRVEKSAVSLDFSAGNATEAAAEIEKNK